jgi:hypothetical protein
MRCALLKLIGELVFNAAHRRSFLANAHLLTAIRRLARPTGREGGGGGRGGGEPRWDNANPEYVPSQTRIMAQPKAEPRKNQYLIYVYIYIYTYIHT